MTSPIPYGSTGYHLRGPQQSITAACLQNRCPTDRIQQPDTSDRRRCRLKALSDRRTNVDVALSSRSLKKYALSTAFERGCDDIDIPDWRGTPLFRIRNKRNKFTLALSPHIKGKRNMITTITVHPEISSRPCSTYHLGTAQGSTETAGSMARYGTSRPSTNTFNVLKITTRFTPQVVLCSLRNHAAFAYQLEQICWTKPPRRRAEASNKSQSLICTLTHHVI